jgi:Rrf2 family protein
MISLSAEYALRAVVCLAAGPGTPMTTHEIAAEAHIPAGYLAKVLQVLVRGGIVTSQRGVNGGFVLARPTEAITFLDVVHLADGSRRIGECPLHLPAHAEHLCPLHKRLDDVIAIAEGMLADSTIADILHASTCMAAAAGGEGAGCLGLNPLCKKSHPPTTPTTAGAQEKLPS